MILQFLFLVAMELFNVQQNSDNLTGATHKSWYLHSKTPEAASTSCQPSAAHALDNQWIFSVDGTFEYDHGSLIQGEACQSQDCCSDLINLVGNWQLSNNETTLTITALHEKGNANNSVTMVLLNGSVLLLDDDQLVVQQTINGVSHNLEFRKK